MGAGSSACLGTIDLAELTGDLKDWRGRGGDTGSECSWVGEAERVLVEGAGLGLFPKLYERLVRWALLPFDRAVLNAGAGMEVPLSSKSVTPTTGLAQRCSEAQLAFRTASVFESNWRLEFFSRRSLRLRGLWLWGPPFLFSFVGQTVDGHTDA